VKTQAITLMKEDVLSLGRTVNSLVAELAKLLAEDSSASFSTVEQFEEESNAKCQGIEEKCLDLLNDKQELNSQEIRTLVGSTLLAAKFERLADHAHRVAKLVVWSEGEPFPPQLQEMASVVHRMVEDVLFCFLTDAVDRLPEIIQRDSHVNYLHDVVSKNLLSHLGSQDPEKAQLQTRFLFCARYLERMGDCCVSIAKRTHFIVTGERLKSES
jgi:phosphate transport system protein